MSELDSPTPPRPATPQVLLHRLPDKPADPSETTRKPSKYIILLIGSTDVAGKLQIARSVASALSCPLQQGDSLHESSAKAAAVGSSQGKPNEARYQRLWLSKLTRTGLLFPEESRPATEGFSGFGGTSSTSTSRRGSASSVASMSSTSRMSSSVDSISSPHPALPVTSTFPPSASASGLSNAMFTLSEKEQLRRANPALMVLTHPGLDSWHKRAIRTAVGDYGIGVIFVPLSSEEKEDEDEEEEDLPILQPLDPTTMTSFSELFGTFAKKTKGWGSLDREIELRIDVNADVKGKTEEIIESVRNVMGVDE